MASARMLVSYRALGALQRPSMAMVCAHCCASCPRGIAHPLDTRRARGCRRLGCLNKVSLPAQCNRFRVLRTMKGRQMPTRKIAEPKDRGHCRDPEHNPPSMMVYENGLYEHTCPSCGAKKVFRVNRPTFSSSGGQRSKPDEIGTWDPRGAFLPSYDAHAPAPCDYRSPLQRSGRGC